MSSSPVRKREATQELLDDETPAKRQKTTSRPSRTNAGKKALPAGFVNTEEALTREDNEEDTSEVESDIDDDSQRQRLAHKRRGKSPPPPDLPSDPPELDDILAGRVTTDGAEATVVPTASSSLSSAAQVNFTFHVPAGQTGPVITFHVQMPSGNWQNSWQKSNAVARPAPSLNTKTKAIRRTPGSPSAGPKRMGGISTGNQAGFLDLPAELRNDIYKRIIVEKNKVIKFAPAENFSHHAALLRTCKTVYQEARQFLYGEHEFHFKRCGDVRGHFWDAEPKEVGWADIRRFLLTIGPHNIAELRKIRFTLADAPSPTQKNVPYPEFASDDNLLEAFKMLAQHGALRKITLEIRGRKAIKEKNERFLHNLKAVQADKVVVEGSSVVMYYGRSPSYWGQAHINKAVGQDLVAKMTRKKKLYSRE